MSDRDQEMIAVVAGLEDEDDLDTETVRIQPPRHPSQVYSVRIPVERIEQLRVVASEKGTTPTALMRSWVIERLDETVRTQSRSSIVVKLPRLATKSDTTSFIRSLRVPA